MEFGFEQKTKLGPISPDLFDLRNSTNFWRNPGQVEGISLSHSFPHSTDAECDIHYSCSQLEIHSSATVSQDSSRHGHSQVCFVAFGTKCTGGNNTRTQFECESKLHPFRVCETCLYPIHWWQGGAPMSQGMRNCYAFAQPNTQRNVLSWLQDYSFQFMQINTDNTGTRTPVGAGSHCTC